MIRDNESWGFLLRKTQRKKKSWKSKIYTYWLWCDFAVTWLLKNMKPKNMKCFKYICIKKDDYALKSLLMASYSLLRQLTQWHCSLSVLEQLALRFWKVKVIVFALLFNHSPNFKVIWSWWGDKGNGRKDDVWPTTEGTRFTNIRWYEKTSHDGEVWQTVVPCMISFVVFS